MSEMSNLHILRATERRDGGLRRWAVEPCVPLNVVEPEAVPRLGTANVVLAPQLLESSRSNGRSKGFYVSTPFEFL